MKLICNTFPLFELFFFEAGANTSKQPNFFSEFSTNRKKIHIQSRVRGLDAAAYSAKVAAEAAAALFLCLLHRKPPSVYRLRGSGYMQDWFVYTKVITVISSNASLLSSGLAHSVNAIYDSIERCANRFAPTGASDGLLESSSDQQCGCSG